MDHTKSRQAFEVARKSIPGGVNSPVRAFRAVGGDPVFVDEAKDQFIVDVDGNRYIDFICSWGPAILGHANDEVLAAVKNRMDKGLSFGMPTTVETRLAEKMHEMLPYVEKVRFISSGTEATMTAVRLARGYTGKEKIIKFNGCYHGHHDSLLVKAGSGGATLGVPDSPGVTPGTTKSTIVCEYNNADEVRDALEGGNVAAVIVEPVAGNMGVIKPKEGFLQALREFTERHEALLIFDEVMTGFRIHEQGAFGLYGVTPDLATFGKVIGGGMPVGAIGGSATIMDWLAPIGPVYQAGTLSGNPAAMECGLKTLEIYERDHVLEEIRTVSEHLAHGLADICRRHRDVSFSIQGAMFTVFFTGTTPSNFPEVDACDMERFRRFFQFMLDEGILLPPSQYEANFLSVKHTKKDIDHYLNALETFLGLE
ncbi:MAG: glutamate-1-semialdehyde-2,1-aminomutase [Acidobacteria bacterium CG_4_9_14_3_um_filter_49_7]|nr:MAG: glutamate-1-semialdehyde-2,1-aminomutase [Acidobacteria bacterium CG_4_9_14_3_um_filter_49_7]